MLISLDLLIYKGFVHGGLFQLAACLSKLIHRGYRPLVSTVDARKRQAAGSQTDLPLQTRAEPLPKGLKNLQEIKNCFYSSLKRTPETLWAG